MRFCRACGHSLPGTTPETRFCPQCGRPTDAVGDWRTDTAERPRVVSPAPRTPPHAGEAPPPARYPLYADEYVDTPVAEHSELPEPPEPVTQAPTAPAPVTPGWFDQAAMAEPEHEAAQVPYWTEERRSPVAWVLVTLAVVVLVLLGWWYLARAQ